uniref:Uncharacterized protein n=1 Tax=Romanomermis culicivorax TaxID=13658 RepID=A0A915J2D7_ROMCU
MPNKLLRFTRESLTLPANEKKHSTMDKKRQICLFFIQNAKPVWVGEVRPGLAKAVLRPVSGPAHQRGMSATTFIYSSKTNGVKIDKNNPKSKPD